LRKRLMLVIVTTHPIQYQVPLWQSLARDGRVPFEVWFLTRHGLDESHDEGFGKAFAWDINLLSGYPHRFLETAKRASPGSFWRCRLTERLRDRLHEVRAKFVWIQGWQVAAYWQAVHEAKSVGARIWLRAESNDLSQTTWWKRPAKRVVLGELFRQMDAVLYIGSANRRLYEKYGVANARLLPAPYAVDNVRFAAQAKALCGERANLREQWGISRDSFCILFCGKFIGKKRPMDLVRAAAALWSRRCPESSVHLLFVGSGELEPALRAACQVFVEPSDKANPGDLRPPATFAGFLNQSEISRAYVAADCLVLPSDTRETWGLVINEALASGLPCIASDACGCAEDLVAPEWIYGRGQVDSLATKLENLRSKSMRVAPKAPPSFDSTISSVAKLTAESHADVPSSFAGGSH
jgi:glycosyltransferase involved in cell wall biosynthesis